MKLSKFMIGLLVLLGIVAIVGFFALNKYNMLVEKQTEVEKASANVQSAYQRRADLAVPWVN